jgi:hypothetical protein
MFAFKTEGSIMAGIEALSRLKNLTRRSECYVSVGREAFQVNSR